MEETQTNKAHRKSKEKKRYEGTSNSRLKKEHLANGIVHNVKLNLY